MPELKVDNIWLGYGRDEERVQALAGISLAIHPRQFTLLVGPSGSGKTSLLSVIGCLLSPDTGSVLIDGTDITKLPEGDRADVRLRRIGFVFQAFRLLKSLNAVDNVALPLSLQGVPRQDALARARSLLETLGLERKLGAMPSHLSGGEKQRVAIARALVADPSILLADEPTASLDSRNGKLIGEILSRIAVHECKIVIAVSHDERLSRYADRIVHLQDGKILEDSQCIT